MHSEKHTIHLTSENLDIHADAGQTVLEALIGVGIFLRTDCGGKGGCGKCRVKMTAGAAGSVAAPDESEIKILGQSDLSEGVRLACRLKISGGISLAIPETSRLSAEVAQKGLPTLFDKLAELKSPPTGLPDSYGLAVDLGTTTVAVYLCNLSTGTVTASTSARNPQILFGDDVMSRISAIRLDPALLARQQKMAVKAIEWGITSLCRSSRIDPAKINTMVVVGNSTMIHIFVGENPSSIGVFPYTPQFVDEKTLRAGSIGFRFNPNSHIRTLPLITGFIGADIVSAALVSELSHTEPGTMLVDVGTNGEIMYLGKNGLSATSCATGPAFEGAAISHGMHAVSGAIDAVNLVNNSAKAVCSVIQQNPAKPKKPAGLCGTGVISTVAELYKVGLILKDGAFDSKADSPYMRLDQNHLSEFIIVPAESTPDGRPVTFTQNDVRAIQLAKGALRTGIDLLCKEAGMKHPTKLLVAGAFGSFINKKDAMRIGMFPRIPEEDIDVVGNAAGAGAILALFDEHILARANDLTRATRVLDLSTHPEFQEIFINSLAFPDP
ncbi:Methyltransferase corrinoid activation protein [Olavius sp. associated proteobacterium Delta 1]|nr:Methyltransferase corrinoid activation protein [Olavius sp. associated proteobacterium Delta 1]